MKKFLAFVTLLCMLLTAVSAMAETVVPSKTAEDMTTVVVGTTETGVVPTDDFVVAATEATEVILDEVTAMRDYVAAEQPLVEYFPEEVQQQIAENLPENVTIDEIVAYELVPVTVANYDETYGDVTVDFTFATVFPEGTEVLVLLGMPKAEVAEGEDAMEWVVKTGTVVEDKLSIVFTQEELARMNVAESLMIVMGAPIAE